VFLGALGQREAEAGETRLDADERPVVRRQAISVAAKAALIAVVAGVLLYLL